MSYTQFDIYDQEMLTNKVHCVCVCLRVILQKWKKRDDKTNEKNATTHWPKQ